MSGRSSIPAKPGPERRRLPAWKKLLFSAITCLVFFGLVELVLWMAGVETLLEKEDPFRGFSGLVAVFERDGDVYRTRAATRGTTFNDQSFLAEKPANGFRVFCLGGSSSYGFPWGAEAAFTGILGEVLAASHPERTIEAVNASGVSYAMHRLNIVADELLEYEPDLFVIYSGHNEFVEPAFFDALKRRSGSRTKVEYALAHSRLYSGMGTILQSGRTGRVAPAFEARVRRDKTRSWTPKEKEEVVGEYRWRLERLVHRARQAGVKVVLATVPCNLRQWRPGKSTMPEHLAADERRSWFEALNSGKRRFESGEFALAAADLEHAARLAPGHAETLFTLACTNEALGHWDKARANYQGACDADASPIRRLSGINAAVREVGRQDGVLLVDMDRIFQERSEHGLVGFNLIEDYVHPTIEGHQLIAWHIWHELAQAGWLGGKQPADRARFDRIIAGRQPVANNAVWFFNQGVVLQNQDQDEAAMAKYREALAIDPDLAAATLNLGLLLNKTGHPAEALVVFQRYVEGDPGSVLARNGLGFALQQLGRLEEAVTSFTEAVRLKPDFAEARNNLGFALHRLGRIEEGMGHYREAVRLEPNYFGARNNLAIALQALGRLEEAVGQYETAVQIEPDYVGAHNNLAIALMQLGRPDEALNHFREAVRLDKNNAGAHGNLARILKDLGRFAEARTHYEEAFRLEPTSDKACINLAWFLATCPDDQIRDGERGLQLARQVAARAGHGHLIVLNTLAAASAETGDFTAAAQWQERALQVAPEPEKEALRQRLAQFRAGQAFREEEARSTGEDFQPTISKEVPTPPPAPTPHFSRVFVARRWNA